MSPRLSASVSISSVSPQAESASSPTDHTLVITSASVAGSVSNEILFRLVVNDSITNAILGEGFTQSASQRQGGTVTVTVSNTDTSTSGTLDGYLYWEVNPGIGSTVQYLVSPVAASTMVATSSDAKWDLSAFSTNMAPATGDVVTNLVYQIHINAFPSTVTTGGIEYATFQSADKPVSPGGAMVIIGA